MKIIKIEVMPPINNLYEVIGYKDDYSLTSLGWYETEKEAWEYVFELKKQYPDALVVPKQGLP